MSTTNIKERAAEQLEKFAMELHKIDGSDYRETLQLADELREETTADDDRSSQKFLPNVGDIMLDKESKFNNDRVEITEVTHKKADDVFISEIGKYVAGANPHFPADDIVVKATYVAGSGDREYSFPIGRLTHFSDQ